MSHGEKERLLMMFYRLFDLPPTDSEDGGKVWQTVLIRVQESLPKCILPTWKNFTIKNSPLKKILQVLNSGKALRHLIRNS